MTPEPTPRLVFSSQMREMDRRTIESGVPAVELMERAGRGAAWGIAPLLQNDGPILILCGPGNNGGDGLVVARYLSQANRDVAVALLDPFEPTTPEVAENLARLPENVRIFKYNSENSHSFIQNLTTYPVLVDALFGTGLTRDIRPPFSEVIEAANQTIALRIALDIPSGLHADRGRPLGTTFCAHHTFTFGLPKIGMFLAGGRPFCGKIHRIGIGIPSAIESEVGIAGEMLTQARARRDIHRRPVETHKGANGHLLLIGGFRGLHGALLLSAKGALKSGTGLVTSLTDPRTSDALMAVSPEVMSLDSTLFESGNLSLAEVLETKTAVAIGPGLGQSPEAERFLSHLIHEYEKPLLLDADALTILSGQGLESVSNRAAMNRTTLLTPHPGEAARLLGCSTAEIQADRPRAARELSERSRATVVLKGAGSLVASPDAPLYLCPFGNPGMAKGGMGDLLTGLLGGRLASGVSATEAALQGVLLHALAGDQAVKRTGEHGLQPSDLIPCFDEIWNAWENGTDLPISPPG